MVPRLAFAVCMWAQLARADSINPVLDGAPETGGEVARIQAHLRFVAARLAHATGLPPAVAARREAALAALAAYIERGAFPQRGADPYPGRRPEFIDARGVPCAVAYLIAASGQPALARALDADYRHAYLGEIRSAALVAWAAENGFTLDELAMIQPTYHGLPTEDGTRRQLEDAQDAFTIQCAAVAPPLPTVVLQVSGNTRGAVTATTASRDPFAICVAQAASQIEHGGHAYEGAPEPYRFTQELHLASPQTLFARRVDALRIDDRCTPRPGPIPSRVDVTLASGSEGLAVHAKTRPANAEVERCVEQIYTESLRSFAAIANLTASHTEALRPRLSNADLARTVAGYARSYAKACAAPDPVAITVSAHRDDAAFTVAVDGAADDVAACLRDKLAGALRYTYTVARPMPDGTSQRYFRIDADVTTTWHTPVNDPAGSGHHGNDPSAPPRPHPRSRLRRSDRAPRAHHAPGQRARARAGRRRRR